MKKIKHFLAFFITVTMIVSGGGLDGFAALSYATENQDEPAVTQEQDTESVEQEEAAVPDQDIVTEDQIEPEESEEPEEIAADVKGSDESEDPAETESEENAFTELSASIKTSDDSKWKVTAIIPDGAGIPENAELIIEETEEQDYDGYLEESAKALKWESTDRAGYARFLNISFKSKGKTIEPSKKVEFTIGSEDVKKNIETMQVVCFGDDQSKDKEKNKEKAEELICEVTENDELVFRTDRMGVFGFVTLDEISLTKKTLKKGNVTLKGMMPEDAKLQTSDEMKAKAVKALEKKKEDTALAAYDITISSEGEEYQPDADHPIQVKIANEAIKKDSNLSIWHLRDDGTKEEVKDFTTADGAVSFEADGFSVYVIIEHEGEEEVVTPRVEFHYISPDYEENVTTIDNGDDPPTATYSYTAPGYQFLNKAASNDEYQISQILTNGESLEKIQNPPNKTDDSGREISFFYGWYTVDVDDGDDTTKWNTEQSKWTGNITYTWPNPKKVEDSTAIEITAGSNPKVGDTITWKIGDTSGTAELDKEGTAHVYIVPVYEDYYFVNFHMGDKNAAAGLRNNLLARRLIVFGQNETTTVRIGNVAAPSPDPAHEIFVGWETVKNNPPETDHYYQTLGLNGDERDILVDKDGVEHDGSPGSGYVITVKKSDSTLKSVDLFPVYAEARWLYYDTGKSGNGAIYVPAAYRLTNDDNRGTYFEELATTTRPGYDFGGWWTGIDGTDIQLTDENGAFVNNVKGKVFYDVDGVLTMVDAGTTPSGTEVKKLYEINSQGRMYVYKDLDALTVHALWGPQTVDYTVVYWLENADDDDYTLIHYTTLQGIAGQETNAQPISPSDKEYKDNKLRFAHLSDDQDKSESGKQSDIVQRTIDGDGSTIVDVYYDRNVYRLRFDVGFSRTTGGTLAYSELAPSEVDSYTGVVYGRVNGQYVALTSDGEGGWTYPETVTTRHNYTDYRYQTTNGTTGTQYGVADGGVVELSYQTASVYRWQYYRGNSWRNAANNTTLYIKTGNTYTDSGLTTSSAFTSDPGEGTYYIYNNNDYRTAKTNGVSSTTSIWTYNDGTNYGNGTRYLRVANDDPNNNYNLGFINGSMQTVSHDAQGWYYNTQDNVNRPYTGTLYKQTINGGTTTYYVSNLTNSYNSNTDRWENFLTQNTVNLGNTNPFNPSDYTGTYISGTEYTVYYYDIVAKYGETILDRYPGSQTQKTNTGGTAYSFVGWIPQADSFYWEKIMSSIKGFFDTMSEDLILTGGTPRQFQNNGGNPNADPDDYTAVTVDEDNLATGDHGVTQEFRCRYKSGGGYNYLYRIYLADPETLDYPSEPTSKIIVTAGSGSTPKMQTAPTYKGYTLKDTKVLTSATDTTGVTPTDTTYSYAVSELTEAGLGNGMIMVYRFQPNEHKLSYKYGAGADPELIGTDLNPTQEFYTHYYNESLSDADLYTDTAEDNVPEGYYFVGWYENPDGVGNAFDFNSKMPDGDIILYAVYKPLRFKVQINPNGAEIDHIDHRSTNVYDGHATPLNRGEIRNAQGEVERLADPSTYNPSQATYFNGTYGERIGEYTVSRSYVPISDTAAELYQEEGGTVFYYVNMQYQTTDGKGTPADLRDALYVTSDGTESETDELKQLYLFYHKWATYEYTTHPEDYPDMIAQNLSYDAWRSLYVQKQENSSHPQLYRACNSKESWVFLGWFKDGENTPYNFSDPVTEPVNLTAHWRLDGGYQIQYTPEYWLRGSDEQTHHINGDMPNWIDPASGASELSYTDGAKTMVYKQPTSITMDGHEVTDNSIVFRGWRIVGVTTHETSSGTVVTYTPLEPGVFYDPGDDFTVKVDYADSNNIIHLQAVYEETTSSVRRPEIANLKLDANTGYLVDADGNPLASSSDDFDVSWDSVGKAATDYASQSIKFGDIQSSEPVHLYKYASDIEEDEAGEPITDAENYFAHEGKYLLLGFDDEANEGDYIATYAADSVISVKRKDDKTIYAVWEPMVYLTLVNDTGVKDISVSLSPTSSSDALEIVNVKKGRYERTRLTDLSSIKVPKGESVTLIIPQGAEKDITISGTNDLGIGKALLWDSSVKLVEGDTTTTYDTAETGADVTYNHGTHTHTLVTGGVNNGKTFSFNETLISNENAVTVTFTSKDNAYALVLDDNYDGGGMQEYDYSEEEIATVGGVPKKQVLPSTSTRIGYEFQGWAYDKNATTPDYSPDRPVGNPWTITNLQDFFSTGTTQVDNTIVRTLYAVWKTRDSASHVYIYKDVPVPGNQKQEFEFTAKVEATYKAGSHSAEDISASKIFKLAHGEYAEMNSSNSTTSGYIQTVITLFNADGTRKKGSNGQVLDPITVKAQAQNVYSGGSFNNTEKISVTETSEPYYTTTLSRLSQVNNDNYLKLANSTDYTTIPLKDIEGNFVTWFKTDAGGSVVFKNTRETHDIKVTKTLISNTSAAKTFTYSASYIDGETTTQLDDFTVTSGTPNGTTLEDIPAGCSLTITEAKDDNYDTKVSVNGGTAQSGKTVTIENINADATVAYTNTLKSYPVKFVKTDQDGNTGVVEALFNLKAVNYGFSATGLLADDDGGDGVFYPTTDINEPLYAGETYTLTETYVKPGYEELKPVTITVSGTSGNEFTFTDADGKTVDALEATFDDVHNVWVIKVKNQEIKKITVKKALVDPMVNQVEFDFSYSYKFKGKDYTGTLRPLTPSIAQMDQEEFTVPVGATNLKVTENLSQTMAATYETTIQEEGASGTTTGRTYELPSVTDDKTVTFTNTRKTVDVTVKKTVEGAGGDFTFTALLQNTSDAPMKGYTIYDDGTTSIVTSNVDETAGQATFTLSPADNGTASQVLTVPYGAHLTVTEKGKDGYDTTVQVDGGTAAASLTTGKLTITVPTTITFTNSEVIVAPTGYVSRQMPYICIGLLALLLLAVMAFGRRRRNWAAEG